MKIQVGSREDIEEEMQDRLRRSFRPEFLNRIDETIIFNPLGKEDLRKIVELEIEKVQERLSEQEIKLEVTDAAKDYLAEKGFDPEFGARPLRRLIQKEIENEVSGLIISGEISEGDTVKVGKRGSSLQIS